MRFRLRYRNRELDLPEGSFTVGRSSSCQLFLDDPLVSRRHAVFLVSDRVVTVEDQKSRNGTLVNGSRIQVRMPLQPGDRVLIGSMELALVAAPSEVAKAIDQSVGRTTMNRVPAPVRAGAGLPIAPAPSSDADASTVRRMNAFKLLSEVSEKALAFGRADEAERLLTGPLAEIIEACRSGQTLAPTLVDSVARLAAKLASATGNGKWLDYVFELYRAQQRPCPALVIDELNGAIRRVNAIDVAALRAYLSLLHARVTSLGPADRFLLQRLEGFERQVALR